MSREFLVPNCVLIGENALSDGAVYFKDMGKSVLIISGKYTSKQKCYMDLKSLFEKSGVKVTEFNEISGEPDDIAVNLALKVYKENNCDCLASIGGGSALDTMKAVAVLAKCGGSIADYMGKQITGKLPPMVAIPTTAGTGSEATKFTIITDSKTDIKMLLGGNSLIPDIAIVDPKLTVSMPKGITAATGLDALTHAIESYTSRKAQPLTDSMAISAVKRIFKYLPIAYKNGDDRKARGEMAVAAFEAGVAINNASVTIVHGMSRPIGANFHVPHGISNAMLLEKCLSFVLDGAYERFGELARVIGVSDSVDDDKTASEKLISAIKKLCRVCEIPTLEEYGIDKDKFFDVADKMAEDALASGSPSNTMKTVTKEDILKIYRQLW
jgi:alcohol dehydrogenase class IV